MDIPSSAQNPNKSFTDQDVLSHIASRIKLLRNIRNLTLVDLSSNLGISYQQMLHYEQGQTNISVGRLWQIAAALNTNINFFYDGLYSKTTFDKDDLEFIRLFNQISNPDIKQSILDFLRSI